jgi:N-acetylglucosamine-6-phosphate deacetylase
MSHRRISARLLAGALGLLLIAFASIAGSPRAVADRTERSGVVEGLHDNTPAIHALTNARIVLSPGKVIERGTLVIRNGVIEAVGADVAPPADARVWDAAGKTIYPGLVDAYSEIDEPTPAAPGKGGGDGEELLRPASAAAATGGSPYWNPRIAAQVKAAESYHSDSELNKKFRSQGIVARLVAPSKQIVKGTSAAVTTGDGDPDRSVLRSAVGMHARLTPSSRRGDDRVYPNSPMGAYALVRQAIYDARWYASARAAWQANPSLPRPEQNDALEALGPVAAGKLPLIIDAPDELYALRADRIAREFDLPAIVRGSGQEYRRLELIAAAKRPIIVPVNFAKAPNMAAPEQALTVTLDELMDWDLQPENPGRLQKAGVKIALTAHGLKDKATFLPAVRKAVKRGLEKDAALAALTTTPAELLAISATHGSIAKGMAASFVVTDGDLFADKTQVMETWVDGRRYEVTPTLTPDPRGKWTIAWNSGGAERKIDVSIAGTAAKLTGSIPTAAPATGPSTRPADAELSNLSFSAGRISFTFKAEKWKTPGVARISAAVIDDVWIGQLFAPDGAVASIRATRIAPSPGTPGEGRGEGSRGDALSTKPASLTQDPHPNPLPEYRERGKKDDPTTRPALYAANYPLGAFGRSELPPRPHVVLFTNATIWTCGPQGKIERGKILVRDGKIDGVFTEKDLPGIPADAQIIDCDGKHISPGIIDCHSHSATDGGINESGRAVTCNVRIGDFIDPDDINIYRQLAGGVTSANVLHGSANPIGGQNQVVKLRWGAGPEELKFAGAAPGVKFALGENVKQSNWGEKFTTRYPQSRLGVEQIIRDSFFAARDYHAAHERFKSAEGKAIPPRLDLEMEALWEIVSGKRLIHCHSYRQDEILALLRTCEQFNVKIATLQHILEGYKVADAISKHGAGGSTFSDWWAYKFEVYDAIPYNGQLMRDAGIVVSFNSDDSELARRLNLEAAKAMKYGNVPEEEALKFVTLNPAKQLRIDDRVGSIERGKDADLVIWSGSPLSTLGRCEQTWIDGQRFFDREEDQKLRQRDADRRAKLVQKALAAGQPAGPVDAKEPRERDKWTREDLFCGCRVEGGR